MTNSHLMKAFTELHTAEAQNLPAVSEVEAVKGFPHTWSGKDRYGSPWQLTKHSEDSYSVQCGH